MSIQIYARRLSATEVKQGFIMILKSKVKLFPPSGSDFSLKVGHEEFVTRINKIPCTCQGPDKPHVHWHLDASQFMHLLPQDKPGIIISRIDSGYELEIL
jgi:hypothetical protein